MSVHDTILAEARAVAERDVAHIWRNPDCRMCRQAYRQRSLCRRRQVAGDSPTRLRKKREK